MTKKTVSAEEKAMMQRELQWQAEDDARILKRAAEIQASRQREARAKKVIENELKSLQKIAGKVTNSAPKRQTKKK